MTDTTPSFATLSVLVPVYNESRTLDTIAERILASPVELEVEVVMVDDGSSDDSWEIMERPSAGDERIKIIRHPHNQVKDAAIRPAIDAMTGDIATVQDADLEYDPTEFGEVIGPILSGHADAVFGSRFASSAVRRVLFYWYSLGNKVLTWLFNILNDLNLTDIDAIEEFNRLGALGWSVPGRIWFTRVGKLQAHAFSLLTPLARRLDGVVSSRGLSSIVSTRRRD